jgi:hypothetical protein
MYVSVAILNQDGGRLYYRIPDMAPDELNVLRPLPWWPTVELLESTFGHYELRPLGEE